MGLQKAQKSKLLRRNSMVSEEFKKIVRKVLQHEGGYVNDPDDPGGETKYGISKRAFPKVDIKNLTEDEAIEIYHDRYWVPSRVQNLPERLWATYFDMAVNMGRSKAVWILQEACNHKNKDDIVVDGKIGRNTIKASKNLEAERLRSFRVKYYANLVDRKPNLAKYYYGWYKRAVST